MTYASDAAQDDYHDTVQTASEQAREYFMETEGWPLPDDIEKLLASLELAETADADMSDVLEALHNDDVETLFGIVADLGEMCGHCGELTRHMHDDETCNACAEQDRRDMVAHEAAHMPGAA